MSDDDFVVSVTPDYAFGQLAR
ncbi:MAG: hypothetical protein JWM10_3493, partial [Myxococcaceae bacterium]|nr:hypothetical protein [Myxococcaceae bacterium]